MIKKNERKILKKYEVTITLDCLLQIYTETAIQDLKNFIAVWNQVHENDCPMVVKAHKEIPTNKK